MAENNQASKKSEIKKLKEQLFLNRKNTVKTFTEAEQKKADKFCEEYKKFLDSAKTEREAAREAVGLLVKAGFSEFVPGKKYKAGDKFYTLNRGKSVIAVILGRENLQNGVNLIAAHIDSPRLDLKQRPLYEEAE
ncbi:MAG: aminopeptidase, partial [Oscillospiraceae bacterium]|nr:aminopeptidase [Oscillospiraceae bacterium]